MTADELVALVGRTALMAKAALAHAHAASPKIK